MRIGVFICHCGTNIAGTVDVVKVAESALRLPNVVYATDIKHACAENGQRAIQNAIREKGLTRVVVAACTPLLHERTFRRAVEKAGLNPFLLEIANIREQCSWVHLEREEATNKAIELVRMAVAKASLDEALSPFEMPMIKRALVVGGGIAGIQAAIDIALAGYEVTIVEKLPSIGGRMALLDKTFPTLDCAACILTPRMVEVLEDNRITLHTYSEVESVSGYVGNFEVKIKKKARSVDLEKCTGCGLCQAKCPVKPPADEYVSLSERKAIYIPFPQATPNVPVIDRQFCLYFTEGKCRVCEKICPFEAVNFSQMDEVITEKFGVIIVATGFSLFDHTIYGEYGYGKYPNIITGLDFERLLNSAGPTGGEILRPSDREKPKSVVFVQCVGSRDPVKGMPYCSKVCCMYTAKHALLLKERDPEAQAYIFYIDIRAAGKNYEEFVDRAREEFGVQYIRGRVSKIYQKGKKLMVNGADTLLGRQVEVEADLVVLASAAVPTPGAADLARKIGVASDSYGFFIEAHPKLRPVEALTEGIFVAGSCQAPRDIPDTVAAASAVSAKACGFFSKDYLTTEPVVAIIDPVRCTGCLACMVVCPFEAINARELKGALIAEVNPVVCKGCGLCVSTCYPSAAQLKGFSDEQILKEVEALL